MARKVDEAANFIFVQLIEQEPGIYDKRHPDYARQDKTNLAWKRISHETKGEGTPGKLATATQPQFPRIVIRPS
jgi:hypothetical protein